MNKSIGGAALALIMVIGFIDAASAKQAFEFLDEFRQQARKDAPAFTDFDAGRGERFFKAKHGDWSCSTCHTEDPRKEGKHSVTEKVIKPLAPLANPERFTDPKKVAKWFKRNCNDVLDRPCTAEEKGDVLSYLLGLKN